MLGTYLGERLHTVWGCKRLCCDLCGEALDIGQALDADSAERFDGVGRGILPTLAGFVHVDAAVDQLALELPVVGDDCAADRRVSLIERDAARAADFSDQYGVAVVEQNRA